jgi:hypothetical protein
MRPSTSQRPAVILGALQAFGFDPQDFLVDECEGPQELGSGRHLVLQRRSTGELRVYRAQGPSRWFVEVVEDLQAGRFGRSLEPAAAA